MPSYCQCLQISNKIGDPLQLARHSSTPLHNQILSFEGVVLFDFNMTSTSPSMQSIKTLLLYSVLFVLFESCFARSKGPLPSLAPYPTFSPRKIVLLHLHDEAPFFQKLGSLTLENKARYAARHGYELAYRVPEGTLGLWNECDCGKENAVAPPSFVQSSSLETEAKTEEKKSEKKCLKPDSKFDIDFRAPTFGKIKLTLAACKTRPGYWALWTDADALVVNQTIPLESIIDDRYDIQLSVDWLMINAGMILFKCSSWTTTFLKRVYDARQFDQARALDQAALQHFFDTEPNMDKHLKMVPKHAINVYAEEYRPGDFLLHMAGKLYEATTAGATAIANQFDILSMIDDYEDVASFFTGRYFLNAYSGTCDISKNSSACPEEDDRRIKLKEPLLAMSYPNRYRHVALRYYWIQNWSDIHDLETWQSGRVLFDPSGVLSSELGDVAGDTQERTVASTGKNAKHDEL